MKYFSARLAFASICAGTLIVSSGVASGATYYVDAMNGNDNWNGLSSGIPSSGTTGPWQTLKRLSKQALTPGDTVLLRCGTSWKETLKLFGSGSTTAPIHVSSYPEGCADPARIDGRTFIPAHAWQLDSGYIFKAPSSFNLVSNGTFGNGITDWRTWSPSGDARLIHKNSCTALNDRCLEFVRGSGSVSSVLSSASFSLDTGVTYRIKAKIRSASGTSPKLIVRRNGAPFNTLGFSQTYSGNSAWQTVDTTFTASAYQPAARIDLELPAGTSSAEIADVRIETTVPAPLQLIVTDGALVEAHHPNRGFDATRPDSHYARITSNSATVASTYSTGSSYLNYGSDLALPSGATLAPGLTAHIRTEAWQLDSRKITSATASRINLDAATSYPIRTGWGFFLTGARWMLDSPGEWFHDPNQTTTYVWLRDGSAPGNRVAVSSLDTGADLTSQSNIVIENMQFIGTRRGVVMENGNNLHLTNVSIVHTVEEGVNAVRCFACSVRESTLLRTGTNAIMGAEPSGRMAEYLSVIGNYIEEAAVLVENNRAVSYTRPSTGAVTTGRNATVSANRIVNTGYHGIRAHAASRIDGNHIANTCRQLNDCGGIYFDFTGNDSYVSGNLIEHVFGSTNGLPVTRYTHGVGIYLDEQASGTTVENNTVIDADYGIQVHNAARNSITGNTLYGNRRIQLFLQEQTAKQRASGDLYDNTVSGNLFFPTNSSASVFQDSEILDTPDFATYSGNRYSALISADVVTERWPGGSAAYTLDTWQSTRSAGASRNLDSGASAVTPTGYAAFEVIGASRLPVGAALFSPTAGWAAWNETSPTGTLDFTNCSVGPCVRLNLGGGKNIVSSPNFSVVKDQWYRISFDLTGPEIAVATLVRRGGGGPTPYQRLMPAPGSVIAGSAWQRFSLTFKALDTAAPNEATGERGARFDLEIFGSGKTVHVANLELVPLGPIEEGLKTFAVSNTELDHGMLIDCPDSEKPERCDDYVSFRTLERIVWPMQLDPLSAEVIFSRNADLVDSDGDGIANFQDDCSSTPAGKATTSRGCALGE